MTGEKDILFFCPRWGSEELPWPEFLEKVKAAGYDGVEWAISAEVTIDQISEVWSLAAKMGMLILPQHYDTVTTDFIQHLKQFKEWFAKIEPFRPLKINTQTGKDFFNTYRNRKILVSSIEFSAKTGIPVCHETHRGKFSFAAHITSAYLHRIPSLRLTLDLSHWVSVAESLLEDQTQLMETVVKRTDHIHARVGHAEGPQVPDPRMPEWEPALKAHLKWWDQIVARKQERKEQLTITTEFGPYPYMVNVPGSGQPIANQWEVNVYMLNLLKERYSS